VFLRHFFSFVNEINKILLNKVFYLHIMFSCKGSQNIIIFLNLQLHKDNNFNNLHICNF